ncbi:hypothetical protein EDD21DRAFT_386124 [Dissophora ornata]|nr:hypothetical protein BGZ58_009258 [Dissophora ornata]KAI8597168.1 hypothetical protein EDD21DRAFT_386124 [Dissophora ornata]
MPMAEHQSDNPPMRMTDHQSDNGSLFSFSLSDSPTLETLSDQLHQLQMDVLQMVPTMQSLTGPDKAGKSDTKQQEQVLETLAKMERTLGGLVSSLNTATTATIETAMAVAAKNPIQERLEDDMTSPLRDSLRAKIELVKKIMFALEMRPQKQDIKPMPPGDPASIDDDLYIIWCASPNTRWYKHKLFEMMDNLRSNEEKERKRLRDLKRQRERLNGCSDSETEDSAHRQYLRAKIAAIKRAAFEFYPEKTNGKVKPDLPADASLIDLDVFLVRCLRSDDYKDCRKTDGYAKCIYRDTSKFEQELGCVIEILQALDEEERKYLTQKEEKKPAVPKVEIASASKPAAPETPAKK